MASYLPNLSKDNLSLYTIPICWIICIIPRFYASAEYKKATNKDFDARAPRDFARTVADDQGLDSATKGRIIRAEAAQFNGFENMGLFASAVVAGNMARLNPSTLNGLSMGYVAIRFIYNHLYIFGSTKGLAQMRTVTFLSGVALLMALFVQAGRNLNSSILS